MRADEANSHRDYGGTTGKMHITWAQRFPRRCSNIGWQNRKSFSPKKYCDTQKCDDEL